jgi:DNA-directed RNA polymerase subunit alpha
MTELHINQPLIKSQLISHSDKSYQFVIQPLTPGFGYTLGNSLRRLLLSSIPGCAVTRIRINDVTHEYQPIKGSVEDALQIVLNLKQIRAIIKSNDDSVILTLSKKGKGEIFASDFKSESNVSVANKDLYICTLDEGAEMNIEIEVTKGYGYLSSDQINFAGNANPYDMYVDALFSPITNVSLQVEQVRVGDKTNFDKIDLAIETDGTIDVQEAIQYATNLSINTFQNILASVGGVVEEKTPLTNELEEIVTVEDDVDLPKRIKDILKKNEITSNIQLVSRIDEVESFAGITEKSLETIKKYIESL